MWIRSASGVGETGYSPQTIVSVINMGKRKQIEQFTFKKLTE